MLKPSQDLNLSLISNPSLSHDQLLDLLKRAEVLQAIYGDSYPDIKDPDTPPSVLRIIAENRCGTFTPRLIDVLKHFGVGAIAATSGDEKSDYHVYAALITRAGFTVACPSINQYVVGERGIYCDSRERLRMHICSEKTKLHCFSESRPELFSRVWGNSSITAYTDPRLLIRP